MEEELEKEELEKDEEEIEEDKPQLDIEKVEQDTLGDRVKLSKKGVLSLRHQMIAEYASRGYPPVVIARELKISVKRVYLILRTNTLVHNEIRRIVSEKFSETEKMLGYLFVKALSKIDVDMESADLIQRDKAIDRVLKIYSGARAGGEQPTNINQFFTSGGNVNIQDIDALIIQKRRERGLEPPLIEGKDEKEKDN
jgi:DNA-binding CsgD family transcriptional regulator